VRHNARIQKKAYVQANDNVRQQGIKDNGLRGVPSVWGLCDCRVPEEKESEGKVITFVCPKPDTPSGGVWFIHKIVQLMRKIGIEAVVAQTTKFDVWWANETFDDDMIVEYDKATKSDVWVYPEVLWSLSSGRDGRKIMFVQNAVWGPTEKKDYEGVEVLVCSRHMWNKVKRLYQANVIGKITPYVDPELFPTTAKTKDAVLLIKRRTDMYDQIRDAVVSAGFRPIEITQPVTQKQIAAMLAWSEFYVHYVYPEGWPMACAEAIMSGVIVVGTPGGGGNEFMFNRETAMVVQDPDHGVSKDEFVARLVEALVVLRNDADLRSKMWQQARSFVSQTYTEENTIKEIRQVFG